MHRLDVAGNREIAVSVEYLLDRCDSGETGLVGECPISGEDVMMMFRFQKALRSLAGHLADSVDKEDPTLPLRGLLCAANHNAGFHRRVVKEIGPEAKNALEKVH